MTRKTIRRGVALVLLFNFLQSLLIPTLVSNYDVLTDSALFAKASNNGPNAPEAAGFEPVDATDMVNLSTGDFSYVLPLLNVPSPEGGYPISMSYHAGIGSDLEASWVGLGWYMSVGSINRTQNGFIDDWKDGLGVNFSAFQQTITRNSVGVGLSVPLAKTSLSVGASWGSGQGLAGFVAYNSPVANAYADTDGNWSYDYGVGMWSYSKSSGDSKGGTNVNLGYGGFSVSANLNDLNQYTVSGGHSFNIDESQGISGSIGMSLTDTGYSVGGNAGFTNQGTGGTTSIGASFSNNNISQADVSTNIKNTGLNISIPIIPKILHIDLFGGKKKIKHKVKKGKIEKFYGSLYSDEVYSFNQTFTNPDNNFNDYNNRNASMDTYEQEIPKPEEDFVSDQLSKIENANFSSIAYDGYAVNGQGIMGNLSPRVFQNINLIGKGIKQTDGNQDNKLLHLFYHKGTSNILNKNFGGLSNSSHDLFFYFNGQFNSREIVSNSNISSPSSFNDMGDFLSGGGHSSSESNGYNRASSPNFVEVFTNLQIENNSYMSNKGLITPKEIPNSQRTNPQLFDENGIGAYKITAPDGKTYHYSLPVYHFEQVERQLIESNNESSGNVADKITFSRYATHWLLTAITGPDFVDSGNLPGKLDEGDYGYWVEFEYGKWSDGFVWRTPWEDDARNFNTNLLNNIEEGDEGSYGFGRKQLYYLDKVKTRTHTAIFVKDIRKDNVGKELNYFLRNGDHANLETSGTNQELNYTSNIHVKEWSYHSNGKRGVYYPKEYTLKLDKIVLIKNEDADLLSKSNTSSLSSTPGYVPDPTPHDPKWESPHFKSAYNEIGSYNYTYNYHQEDKVFDINDVSEDFIAQKALKVIQMDYDYALAKNSPSSEALNQGKLTLNAVHSNGIGNTAYMPPTTFDYYGKYFNNISFAAIQNDPTIQNHFNREYTKKRREFVDDWGYMDEMPHAWSLKSISLTTGANVEVEYEEDKYWTEAFSRGFWQDNLLFVVTDNGDNYNINIENQPNISPDLEIEDFNDYFKVGKEVFLDLCVQRVDHEQSNQKDGRFDVNKADFKFIVASVQQEGVQILAEKKHPDAHAFYGDQPWIVAGHPFFKADVGNSLRYIHSNVRCSWPSTGAGADHFTMMYKLLANKVPEDINGGGLRVKEVKTISNAQTYRLAYNYNFPNDNDRSSGITSVAPSPALRFVPYQIELPPAGVKYEYVTISELTSNNSLKSKTRYHFHSLDQVFDIFEPEIELATKELNGGAKDKIFWADVNESTQGSIEKRTTDIYKNYGIIGQLKSIEYFNAKNQLVLKTENEYSNGANLTFSEGKGYVRESFNSMKSTFNTNTDGELSSLNLKRRYLSVSSKTEFNNILKKTINYHQSGKDEIKYDNIDPFLGTYNKMITHFSNGTKAISEKLAAHTIDDYELMGPKYKNYDNKHMLTQEAYNVTTHLKPGQSFKTISAAATTWHNHWNYNLPNGTTESSTGIWRKHKNFIWKGDIDEDGYYSSTGFTPFTFWNAGSTNATSEQQDANASAAGWEKVSEVTRYTPYSTPVETKDINGNFASSKMDNKYQYVLMGGNAKQRDMHARGFEDIENNTGSLAIPYGMQVTTAHTGDYGIQLNSGQSIAATSSLIVDSDKSNIDATTIGDYKASLWFLLDCNELDDLHNSAAFKTVLNYGGNDIYPDDYEYVKAGRWLQLNYFLTEDNNNKVDQNGGVSIKNVSNRSIIIDDFRFHPIESSVASYNYDALGRLQSIIGANGFGSWYVYDEAGRLCSVYTETADKGDVGGGFKKVSDFKQNYANQADVDCNGAPPEPELCIIKGVDWGLKDCGGLFKIAYVDKVVGGSGDFTYQWSWIEDDRTATQTNPDFIAVPTQSNNIQHIPFARDFIPEQNPEGIGACPIDSENGLNQYKKYWRVRLELIDNQIGGIVYTDELMLYNTSDCFTPKSIGFEEYTCEDLNCNSNERHMLVFYDPHMTGSIENPLGVDRFDNYRFALYGTSNIIPNFSHFIGIGETCIPCTAEQIKTYQFLNDNQVNFALTNMECDTSHVERINYYEQETSTVPYIIDHYEKRSNKEVYQKNYEIKK